MSEIQDTYVALFLKYLEGERRVSPETLRGYGDDLHYFKTFLISQNGLSNWESVDTEIIRFWIVSMANKGNKPSVIRRRVAGISAFYKFLLRGNMVEVNPADGLPLPKISKRLPRFISIEGMKKLGTENFFTSDFKGNRDRLILELLYGTGMRRAEVSNLRDIDIQWERREIKIRGKGGKSRLIPVSDSLFYLMAQYRKERDDLFQKEQKHFLLQTREEMFTRNLSIW